MMVNSLLEKSNLETDRIPSLSGFFLLVSDSETELETSVKLASLIISDGIFLSVSN